ncbi:DUF192 domain-containing protein [Patescibacteria group bacterium]|nr:DUF192 domain-containing protein [Patescibacteria group bacterium]MBU1967255.1 DUF192 domain-containing protein [Patescibacteria group bacterium]MBU2543758.1 DUF192 domain-containing protein [Patescibacteria group bacterium]
MRKLRTILLFVLGVVILGAILGVILGGCGRSRFLPRSLSRSLPRFLPQTLVFRDHQLVTAQLGNSPQFKLEVVNTPQSITQGLGGRDELGVEGMLFVFGQELMPAFWMKEMRFDLDLVWIKDMRVVEITERVPAPIEGVSATQLPTYSPSQSVDMVLEVKAGQVQEWGIYLDSELILSSV